MPERTSVGTRAEVVTEAFSATSGEVLVVCSRAAVVEAIVAAEASADLPEFVRLLVDETTARDVQRDFLTASRVVDLVEAGGLTHEHQVGFGITDTEDHLRPALRQAALGARRRLVHEL